jgi:CubicO group peptidase (beta-lactamase class C family)
VSDLPPSTPHWPTATPAEVGLDADRLAGIAAQFDAWPAANVHAVLVARRGRLVYEHYGAGDDNAWGRPLGPVSFDATTPHDLRSISKSVVALVFGAAAATDAALDLGCPVFEFFPEHADLATPEKRAIRLEHLLTMSAGLAWDETIPYQDPANSERRMVAAPDPIRYVLEQPVVRPAGATYTYNGGLTVLLAEILARRADKPFEDVARRLLFDPLDIDAVHWHRNPTGSVNAASGLRLLPRDILKFGQLILRQGEWEDSAVVPTAWIEAMTTPAINGADLYFYGFQWWLGRSLHHRREIRWGAGVGWGGQRLYVVPDLDLVVLVLAGLYGDPLQAIVGDVVLRRHVLPAALPA